MRGCHDFLALDGDLITNDSNRGRRLVRLADIHMRHVLEYCSSALEPVVALYAGAVVLAGLLARWIIDTFVLDLGWLASRWAKLIEALSHKIVGSIRIVSWCARHVEVKVTLAGSLRPLGRHDMVLMLG